jgi:hypothetical protein
MKKLIFVFITLFCIFSVIEAEENKDVWTKGNYVDDFGDSIDETFLSYCTIGTFSNLATTNSKCFIKFLIDKEDCTIFLYEYLYYQVKGEHIYNIKIKFSENVLSSNGEIYKNGDRIHLSSNLIDEVLYALNNNYDIRFFILGEYGSYNFIIKSVNWNSLNKDN